MTSSSHPIIGSARLLPKCSLLPCAVFLLVAFMRSGEARAEPADDPDVGSTPATAPQPEGTPASRPGTTPAARPAEEGTDAAASADEPASGPVGPEPAAPPAAVDTSSSPDGTNTGPVAKSDQAKNYSHWRTGNIGVSAGWGYYGILPYDDGVFCGEFATDPDSDTGRKSLCTKANPWFLEFSGGYGVHPRIDLTLSLRLNLQKRKWRCKDEDDPESCKGLFNDGLGFGMFPGIRAWISKAEDMFKFGAEVAFMWIREDFSGYRDRPVCGPSSDVVCPLGAEQPKAAAEQDIKNNDVGLRLGPILQLDPHHNVGIFLSPTARLGFLRWFEFAIDIQLGIQARFP